MIRGSRGGDYRRHNATAVLVIGQPDVESRPLPSSSSLPISQPNLRSVIGPAMDLQRSDRDPRRIAVAPTNDSAGEPPALGVFPSAGIRRSVGSKSSPIRRVLHEPHRSGPRIPRPE